MKKENLRQYRCKVCNRLLFVTEKNDTDVYLYRKIPQKPVIKMLIKNNYYVKCTCGCGYRFHAPRGRLSRYSKKEVIDQTGHFAYPVFPDRRK